MPRLQNTDESFTNEFDATLNDVREVSTRLDRLLSKRGALGYETKIAADMGTASLLLYWQFTESVVIEIIQEYRLSGERDKYAVEIVDNTIHTRVQPVNSALGDALIQSAKKHGGRPAAGVATLSEIQLSFELLGDSLTVTDIIDSDIVTWGDAKRKSVRRRINRGLTILQNAGFVSSARDGRSIKYYSEDIEALSFPSHSHSKSTTHSRIATNAVSSVVN